MDNNERNKIPLVWLFTYKGGKKFSVKPLEVPIEEDIWTGEVKRDTLNAEEIEKFAKSIQEMELENDGEMLKELLKDHTEDIKEKVYSYLGE